MRGTLKLVVPQTLIPNRRDGMQQLQLRMLSAARGHLTVSADGVTIWRTRLSALPERRLSIPLSALPIPARCMALTVTLRS